MTLHKPGFRCYVATLSVLILVLSCQSTIAGPPIREKVDGVMHVRNQATPTGGVETLQMREMWRVGDDDDGDILFGLIPRASADGQGNVYVLDSQLNHVLVFSPTGELLRTLFREGEGPGEIRQPRDMMVMGDGRVGVVQEFPGVIIFVDADGDPAGRIRIGGSDGGTYSLTACEAAGDHFVVSTNDQTPGSAPGLSNRGYYLNSIDDKGLLTNIYCESHAVYDFNNFVFSERDHTPTFWWGFAAGADGRTCATPDRDQYAIHVFAANGQLEMVIEREYKPIKRSDKEYEESRRIYESALTQLPVDYKLIVEREAAAIAYMQRGLRFRPDGSIWALSGRGIRELPAGVLAVFDVFDRSGEFVKQVELRGPGDAVRDGIFFAGDDRIVVVKGYMESLGAQFGSGTMASGEDDEEGSKLAVIYYQLEK